MSDLVKRLRDTATSQEKMTPYNWYNDSYELTEAADRIEQLEARNDALGKAVAYAEQRFAKANAALVAADELAEAMQQAADEELNPIGAWNETSWQRALEAYRKAKEALE